MKKLLIPFITLACCLGCVNSHDTLIYTSAKESPDTTASIVLRTKADGILIYDVEYSGHIYLVTVYNGHGISTIHAEHCPCKNQKSNN